MMDDLSRRLRSEGTVTFTVHVKPGAPETIVTGALADGTLKIALHAPAEGGKANRELVRFVTDAFGVPMDAVTIRSGAGVRRKLLSVSAAR